MAEQSKVFQKAVSGFTFDLAARGAIRHLYDLGYSAEEIRPRLSYPVSVAQIEQELETYEEEKRAAESGLPQYEFIKETDSYGRTTFRRVRKEG